ncbi:MAG: hypothetical protein LBG89_01135 [Rickettsiales bacterium]|jgi:hypothetical protein|nr:hypothetical protein [Rickettsiales bacterium]
MQKKIVFGIIGAMAFSAQVHAAGVEAGRAVLRGAPMPAGNNANLADIVRASAAANVRAPGDVQVVNPNTGNIMTESFLADGTILYTDPVTGEKFVMAGGKLVAYMDEDDRMVPALNVNVGTARNVCNAIEAYGYQGEFNELTYECMVPIVAVGTGGKISSGDGDAVAFYPFGSYVKCDAGMFDTISVMRRNSQYIVPAMIVGGGLAGAGIGLAVDKYQEGQAKKKVDANAAAAGAEAGVAAASSGSKLSTKQDFLAEIERIKKQMDANDTTFWCASLPRDVANNIKSTMAAGTTWNCIAQSELKYPNQGDAFMFDVIAGNLNNAKDMLSRTNRECQPALDIMNYINNTAKFEYAPSIKCAGKTGPAVTIKYSVDGQWKYFGDNEILEGKRRANEMSSKLEALVKNLPPVGNFDKAQYMADRANRVNELKLLEPQIAGSNLSQSEKNDLYIIINDLSKLYIKQDGEKQSIFGKIWDSNVGRGAILGTAVGAVAGTAYFFYEGANTKCDIGGFKSIGLDDTFRMPSFRDFIQTNMPAVLPEPEI